MKFHDGTPLDAAAVVAHFKRMMDPKNALSLRQRPCGDRHVEATGPLEVTFKMKTPSAPFPAVLADAAGMIVSPAAVEKYNDDLSTHRSAPARSFSRNGSAAPRSSSSAIRTTGRPAPYLDQVVLRPMPDEQARYASLKAGNLDVVMNAAADDVIDAQQHKKFTVIDPGSLAPFS